MSKKLRIILISILLFVLGTVAVNANAATAVLTTNSQNVKPGETFSVTFSANCAEGINGVESKISYDEEMLEFIKLEVSDTTKWTNLGENLTAQILHVSSETVTEGEIFIITFKVKDDATLDTVAKIKADSIVIDSEAETNARKEIEAQEIEVKITNSEETEENEGTQENDGVQENQGTQENNGTQENEGTEEKEDNKKAEENKDNTTSEKDYPDTGAERMIFPIIALIIILIASYAGYKKYKEI